jgi:triacylglycerol lipase
MNTQRVYLVPGMFGFGKLAGYDYFSHLELALEERFRAAGVPLQLEVVAQPPTASLTVRARLLAERIARSSAGQDGPIHVLGHSTGGLDARLLLSPGGQIASGPAHADWLGRVRSVVCMNTPHHGTPLAAYFTTTAGTRLLYALSLLTVTSLSLGRLPLTAFSGLVAGIGAFDDRFGTDSQLVDRFTDQLLGVIGERGRDEIHDYLQHVRGEQGGIVQLMPEVMELFNASVSDRPGVRYGCVFSAAPAPGPRRAAGLVLNPLGALSFAVYTTVYGFSSLHVARYPYATPTPAQARCLELGLGRPASPAMVDGIVPTLSMLWGEPLWCGAADHLDVVGHFADERRPARHVDWLSSHAGFRSRDFARMVDAITEFMLADG